MGILGNLFDNNREKRLKKRYELRDRYWNVIGELSSDVLVHVINPAFMGMPEWPDLRQAYNIIRTNDTIILATNGLSDDYKNDSNGNGLGIELFIETNDKDIMNKSDTELGDTWLFQILFQAAGNAVKSRAYYDAINQYKYVSSEFGNININDNYKTINDGVGVLLGIERKNSPSSLNFDNQKIFMISITALMNIEFEMMMENGKEGRENVVRKLKEKNLNNVIDLHREKIEI